MSAGIKANNDGSGAIQVGGSDAILIDTNLVSAGRFTSGIQPITASVAANALTITLDPTSLAFRSSTLTSGTVNVRRVTSAISMTVSSGSTLGTVNAVASRLVVLAIDNAGTVELAVVNISGGNQLDETNLITTVAEGGAGAADSASVIYSTTARTNVPYRVVGFIDSTQATAGTWATAPSTIQGVGGQALTALSSVGYGQTYQAFSPGVTRIAGTTYYNTTGKPIMVAVRSDTNNGNGQGLVLNVNGITVGYGYFALSSQQWGYTVTAIVPPGASYVVTVTVTTIAAWVELR